MVTGWTDDDAVFTAYVRHLLVSDTEYAQRYCLSELPAAADLDWLAREVVERLNPSEIAARTAQFRIACDSVLRFPRIALRRYGVTMLLWNETLRPDWRIDPQLFTKTLQGEGWSLWTVRDN